MHCNEQRHRDRHRQQLSRQGRVSTSKGQTCRQGGWRTGLDRHRSARAQACGQTCAVRRHAFNRAKHRIHCHARRHQSALLALDYILHLDNPALVQHSPTPLSMSWRLGVLGLTAVVAAPVAPVHRQLPPAEGLTSTPAPPPAPRQASAADPIVPQDGGEGTTKMGIIVPLVIAGAIAIAVLYFVRPQPPTVRASC